MDNNKHIDEIIREKFETFTPSPPDHIWSGIEEGISIEPYNFFLLNRRTIAISAILLLSLLASIMLFGPLLIETSPNESGQTTIVDEKNVVSTENNEDIESSELNIDVSDHKDDISNPEITETKDTPGNEIQIAGIKTTESKESDIESSTISSPVEPNNNIDESNSVTEPNDYIRVNNDRIDIIKMKRSVFVQPEIYSNLYEPESRNFTQSTQDEILMPSTTSKSSSAWKIGYYIAPELSISDFDSVQILNSYTISAEPSYFFNDHWFVRFGVGLSFVRDRGFAKISYFTNEYMGSYDDVYDITFDTVSGNIIPIYHTKTIEVWDSVRHVSVSEVTNNYVYLQVPALFGYYHKKVGSDIAWYFMGGPAFNLKVGSWIEDPKPEEKDADIIDLQNNLPIRSNNYFQLWLGAGLEYELNKKLSIAFEPGYRYYFKSIYKNPYNSTSSSGFTLRIGLVYLMK